MSSLVITKDGSVIESVQSWRDVAPPRDPARQWVDGRSAKELARAFCGDGKAAVPPELGGLLRSSQVLGSVELVELWPEHAIPLDSYRGETRNADLAGVGTSRIGTVAVTLEAKADEEFGKTVGVELARASERSNVPKRVDGLAQALLGRPASEVGDLRYQLLHGAAASLIVAGALDARAALFIVFEFRGPSCSEQSLRRNDADLQRLVDLMQANSMPLRPGHLVGPFVRPGGGAIPTGIPLFIGKVVRELGAQLLDRR